MSSIVTNSSAMTALQNLSATQKALNTTQLQISSGLKVSTASDNAAYWSLGTRLRSSLDALGAASQAINVSLMIVNNLSTAANDVMKNLNTMKKDMVLASQSSVSLDAINDDVKGCQSSIINLMASSTQGINIWDGSGSYLSLIDGCYSTKNGMSTQMIDVVTAGNANQFALGGYFYGLSSSTIVGSGILGQTLGLSIASQGTSGYTASSSMGHHNGTTTITCYGAYSSDSILGFSISDSNNPNQMNNDISIVQNAIDKSIGSVANILAKLGSAQTVLNLQLSSTEALSNTFSSGLGSLVDVDMNVASTRLQALQTQQQLGIQALSIANADNRLILKLFGTA